MDHKITGADTLDNISLLYELSLSVGSSLDLKANCDNFLKTLMEEKNLTYASVWIRDDYLSDQGEQGGATLVYANPESRIQERRLPLQHPMFTRLINEDGFSVASSDSSFSQMITERGVDSGTFAVFALGEMGALKLLSPSGEELIKQGEFYQLLNVLAKFAISLEGCLSHQRAIREVRERVQAEETLNVERALLRILIDNLPDYIFVKDANSRFVINNAAHIRVLGGSSQDEVVGKTDFDIFPLKLAEQYFADEQEVIRSGKALLAREETTIDPQGRTQWLLTSKVPLRDSNGEIIGLVGISRDITERLQTEEELRTYAARLERSNRELQDFAYIASHDLQEPLRKVIAFGDRLRAKYGELIGEQGLDYLERMQSASKRMQALIDGLLSYSRVTTQAKPFESVDLGQVTCEVLSDLEVHIEQVGGQVDVDELPTIHADPTQMRQLFQNLIGNALKFRREDEPPVVKVSARFLNGPGADVVPDASTSSACQITVEDNGIGFDEKYLDRIFQVFQRLHSRSEYTGTGIGLATCRKIAERHGGDITAKSGPGQGACFIVTLPTRQAQLDDAG